MLTKQKRATMVKYQFVHNLSKYYYNPNVTFIHIHILFLLLSLSHTHYCSMTNEYSHQQRVNTTLIVTIYCCFPYYNFSFQLSSFHFISVFLYYFLCFSFYVYYYIYGFLKNKFNAFSCR